MLRLTTERLRLRPFTDDDAQFVLEMHRDPDLVRFIPSAACSTLDDALARIARFADNGDDPVLGYPCAETLDGIPVGMILLKPIPPSGRDLPSNARPEPGERWDVEIGWRAHPDHTGHGYLTEAARAALANAFSHGLDRVVAVTDPDNSRSQRVAHLSGMRRIGLTDAYYDHTCVLFDIMRPHP